MASRFKRVGRDDGGGTNPDPPTEYPYESKYNVGEPEPDGMCAVLSSLPPLLSIFFFFSSPFFFPFLVDVESIYSRSLFSLFFSTANVTFLHLPHCCRSSVSGRPFRGIWGVFEGKIRNQRKEYARALRAPHTYRTTLLLNSGWQRASAAS